MIFKTIKNIFPKFSAISVMFKNFEDILIVGVPVYSVILLTMAWRAHARIQTAQNLPKVLCAIGGIFFVISDGLIAFDKFYSPIQCAHTFVMITYYVAQLGITLSIIDHEVAPKGSEKSN